MIEFSTVSSWIFDLDNTLYPAHHDLFKQVDARMTGFIERTLNISRAEAYKLQKAYLHEYGTTLSGLIKKHNMSPDVFLDFVHDIDVTVLDCDETLHQSIAALPGRKFIYTNGTRDHAMRVTQQLGIDQLFDGIFDIVAADYIPKPNRDSYHHMMAHFGITADQSAFFEDIADNLVTAHDLGMTTILVHPPTQSPNADNHHIDYQTDNLSDFLTDVIAH